MESQKIKVIIKKPFKTAYTADIENTLETLQELVEGYVDGVGIDEFMSRHDIAVFVNEHREIAQLFPNLRLPNGKDYLRGTVVFVKIGEDCKEDSLSGEEVRYILQYCRDYGFSVDDLL